MNYRLLIAIAMLMMVGCIQDPAIQPNTSDDGKLFTLSIESFSDDLVGSTRATASPTAIHRGFILFYNSSTGAYKGYESMEGKTITEDGSTISFEVGDDYSLSDKVICIFNQDPSAELPSDFSVVTGANVDSYFPISSDYLAQIEDDMNSGTYALGMPMCVNDFTDSDRAVREVYRAVARLEIFIKKDLTIEHDSHTHVVGADNLKFEIVNASSIGSVGFHSLEASRDELQIDEELFDVSSTLTFPYSLTEYETSAVDTSNKIYLQEFPYSTEAINGDKLDAKTLNEGRLAILLKHSDQNIYTGDEHEARYYKLNLLDKATSTYFDVKRNHNYRVVIKAINSRGYETIKEAYQMPPSNIEYEIYDDQGGLIYSNGQYAIAMDDILSYDEVLVYGNNETTLEFNNIRYVLPDGAQMDGVEFDTNEVVFNIISDDGGLITDVSSDFTFDASGKSVLTADKKSIIVTLEGEGECTIGLRIKLGNLEMGRDQITIKKEATNGGGNGAFDAHPNHFEIATQKFVKGSWQSDDIDFGARPSSASYDDCGDDGTVIYMGENATPTGYRTMDGYISGESSINSYPVFSPKTRRGFYSYIDDEGETKKVMIQLEQLAPFYLGHFGVTASDESLYHYNGLICEKIEEVKGGRDENYNLLDINGVMPWSKSQLTYYKGVIWGDYEGRDRYHNLVDGLTVTRNIVENNTDVATLPTAAHYCYMKNDVNGNNKIDSNEPINWYLPAQNQTLAMWINMNVFQSDIDLYRLSNEVGDFRTYYWSCSEMDAWVDYEWTFPSNFAANVMSFNMLEGQADYVAKNNGDPSGQGHVRCVRGLD